MAATTIAAAPAAQTPAVDTAALAAAARNEERARVQGIVGHAEAAGREELAQHLAFGTDLGVDAAAAILKASPKKAAAPAPANTNANAQPKASPFLAAMQRSDHPNVGPSQGDGEGDTGGGGEMSVAQRVLAAQRKASGGTTDPAARRLSPQQMLEHSRQARR